MRVTQDEPVGNENVIRLEDVDVHFSSRGGLVARLLGRLGPIRAVDGVTLEVRRGEILGIIGESGSGKTTLGRTIIGMQRPTSGRVLFDGADLATMRAGALRRLRKRLQMVFQDPHAALSPTMTIAQSVEHPIRIHFPELSAQERRDRVEAALDRVDLRPAARFLPQRPRALSGGQKQRAVIGRAIASAPEVIVADEPVSMLDTSVRAKILQLLLDLKQEMSLTIVYVTHDLASARYVCDRVAIMYLGRIVEIGPADQIFRNPQHPYTRALLAAIPDIDPSAARKHAPPPRGEVPDAAAAPRGCAFHPRCPVAFDVCGWEPRDLRFVLEQRWSTIVPERYESERSVIPAFDTFRYDGDRLVLTPRPDSTPERLSELLAEIRAESTDEPLFSGIRSIDIVGRRVEIVFSGGDAPELLPAGDSRVACHAVSHPIRLDTPRRIPA